MKLAYKLSNAVSAVGTEQDLIDVLEAYNSSVAVVLGVTDWDEAMPVNKTQFIGGMVIIFTDMSYFIVLGQNETGDKEKANALTTAGDAIEEYDDPFAFIMSLASVSEDARNMANEIAGVLTQTRQEPISRTLH